VMVCVLVRQAWRQHGSVRAQSPDVTAALAQNTMMVPPSSYGPTRQ
jgi:hypothetical protein